MSGPGMRLPGSVAEIAASPEGPGIGAFFDLDGTLIAGYSARYMAEDRIRRRDLGLPELARTLGVAVGAGLGLAGFDDLLETGAQAWKGRAHEDLEEMGERLFRQKLEARIFPEMRTLVRAHQDRGHTVALSSSATWYQVAPVARFLEIDHVLCNRFTVKDGVLTGGVEQPAMWGPTKATVVQAFAAERDVDMDNSYFYADGDEDAALLHLVGHPRPTNPGRELERIATSRGWPILRFSSRGAAKGAGLRTAASLASALPLGAIGAGLALFKGDKREIVNFTTPRWIDVMFELNQVKLKVTGREHLWSHRPAVFIFNHRNNFDAFMTARLVEKDFTGVAKSELKNDPVIGTFGRLADVAFVDRSDSKAAVASLQPIQELAKKGLSIIVAPEGTRMDTTTVAPFKKGAFRMAMAAEIPIVPIVIRNAEMVASRDAATMNPGTVDIAVLAPVPTDDWTLDGLDQHIADVRQLYLDTLANWPNSA